MRNTSSYHRPLFDLDELDGDRRPERMRAANRSRRRIITITRMVRIRIEEFLPDQDDEEDDIDAYADWPRRRYGSPNYDLAA